MQITQATIPANNDLASRTSSRTACPHPELDGEAIAHAPIEDVISRRDWHIDPSIGVVER
jgi:hypothetical protein